MTTIDSTRPAAAPVAPDQLLHRVLQANMVFSGLTGLLLVVDAAPLSQWLGVPATWLLVVLGIGLLGFAGLLYLTARQRPLDLRQANLIFWLDVAWVVGSALLLATGWAPLTSAGWWAVLVVADVVALFAILEFVGIRRAQAWRA
jgi:hypothetical protein